jgi:hypothetical protein
MELRVADAQTRNSVDEFGNRRKQRAMVSNLAA